MLRVARALAHVQLLDGLALVLDDVREVRLRPEHGLELGVRHLAVAVGVDLGHERGHGGRGLGRAELGQEAGDFLRRDAAGAVRVEGLEEFLDVGHFQGFGAETAQMTRSRGYETTSLSLAVVAVAGEARTQLTGSKGRAAQRDPAL